MPPKMKGLHSKVLPDGSMRLSIPCFNKTRGERQAELKNAPYDVKLHIGPDKDVVEAHKRVLIAEIPYFSAMFSGSFQESTKEIIDLRDVEIVAVRNLMELYYKGSFKVTQEDVQDMFVTGDIWDLPSLKQNCVNFMIQEINCHNCFDLLHFGELYSVKSIVDVSKELISREFQIIANLDSFVDLSIESLMELVKRTDLSMGHTSEDVMLEAVGRWIRHNWPQSEQYVEGFLPHFRYSRCSERVREDFISICPKIIKEVVEKYMAPALHDPTFIWFQTQYEPLRAMREKIMVFCGHSHTRSGPASPKLRSVELVDLDTLQSRTVDLPDAPTYGEAFNLMGRIIYFAVFSHTDPATRKLIVKPHIYTFRPEQPLCYNMYRLTPEVFCQEATDRITQCLVSNGCISYCPIKKRIYAVSVKNVDCIKVTCCDGDIFCEYEKSLPNLTAFLNDKHVGMRSVCCKGKLYVIGGRFGPELEVSVSRDTFLWDEEMSVWEKTNKLGFSFGMSKTRSDFAVVSRGGSIVVSGGFGGLEPFKPKHPRRMRDCEKYLVGEGLWYPFHPLRQHKTHHCMVVANDTLYVLGGKTYSSHKLVNTDTGEWQPGGARIVSNIIERHYTDAMGWERVGKLIKGRCMFSAIAV